MLVGHILFPGFGSYKSRVIKKFFIYFPFYIKMKKNIFIFSNKFLEAAMRLALKGM
jgi:hypothetical protein